MHIFTDRLIRGALIGAAYTTMLTGCQSSTSTASSGSNTPAKHAASAAMPTAQDDGEFAAMMGAHHESGIEMGRYEAEHGSRPEVRDLARKIADKQSEEHTRLESIARAEGHAEHKADPAMEEHSQRDMDALRSSQGAELDRQFLIHMMDHHAQGVDMTRRSLPNLRRGDLRRMAQQMIDDQSREIDQMRAMLGR